MPRRSKSYNGDDDDDDYSDNGLVVVESSEDSDDLDDSDASNIRNDNETSMDSGVGDANSTLLSNSSIINVISTDSSATTSNSLAVIDLSLPTTTATTTTPSTKRKKKTVNKKNNGKKGRPPLPEGEEGIKLASVFYIEFRPTRNPDITREEIYEHFKPMCKELIVARESSLSEAVDFHVFARMKDDTAEMNEFNKKKAKNAPPHTNKRYCSDFEFFFSILNSWPVTVPDEKRDDANDRHQLAIRIRVCQHADRIIKKISKLDYKLLFFGLREGEFDSSWRVNRWAQMKFERNEEFNLTDEFVSKSTFRTIYLV